MYDTPSLFEQAKPCVIVAATPDAKHESIPEKFHPAQRYFRSTYREALRNDAIRNVLQPHPSIQYVDLFRPSAALHWDGQLNQLTHQHLLKP